MRSFVHTKPAHMRIFFMLIIGSCFFSCVIAQPTITSFNPVSGPIGTTVTITGTNFNSTASNNIVFFGAVRANVTAATATSLTVTAPAGANCKPITVTANGLTAYSGKPFFITFPNPGAPLTSTSFADITDSTTDLNSNQVVIIDIDGDGKPDIATANNYSSSGNPASFSVLRNTSSAGAAITFAPVVNFANGVLTFAIAAGDLDADGKPDIIVSSIGDQKISVFRNTSTPGTISFAPKINYTPGSSPYGISIGDITGDGKPEIVVANFVTNNISIFKNNGSVGTISFGGPFNVAVGQGPRSVCVQDIDGDGKNDIAVANYYSGSVSIIRNLSANDGFIALAARLDADAMGPTYSVSLADLDGDGKVDIGIAGDQAFGIFRNQSTPGTIALATRQDYAVTSGTHVCFADLNGDTKIDAYISPNKLYQNTSSVGSIQMSGPQYLSQLGIPYNAEVADLNADSWPDIGIVCANLNFAIIRKSNINRPGITGFSPAAANTGQTVTITGTNFTNVTAVNFGGTPATSFTIVNATTITAVVGAGSSGNITVTNSYGTGSLTGFALSAPPVITSFTPTTAGYGQTVTITGSNFYGATAVSFGGFTSSFTIINSTSITATVPSGATGSVAVTTPYGTGTKPGFTYIPIPIINSFTPTSTGQGNDVTITGLNFTAVSAVAFGGVPAQSFIVNSSTSITAKVGAGADGDVNVTNAFGTGVKSGFSFVPVPTVTSFTPATGICGTVLTIVGTNFTINTVVTIGSQSYYSGGYFLVSPDTIKVTLSCGDNNGNISITTAGGSATVPGFIFYYKTNPLKIVPNTGGTGMPVTITGKEFRGVTGVSIGGVPVSSFTVVSPDTIRAIVGAGSSGAVAVYNPANTTGTSTVQFNFADWPVVTSFSPRMGPVGTLVSIMGSGFSTALTNNVVYFGATKAPIVSATANLLKVKVPYGSTYKGITVTRTDINKTGLYDVPFTVTYPGGGAAFDSTSFAGRIILHGAKAAARVINGDIDGDGKPDIILTYVDTTIISVFRNTSNALEITFATPVHITVNRGVYNVATADMNSDGKLDIIGSVGNHLQGFTVLKNTSTPGTISFDPYSQLNGPLGIYDAFAIADVSYDGKPDVIGGCVSCSRSASFNSPMNFYGAFNTSTAAGINYTDFGLFQVDNLNAFAPFYLSQVIVRDMNNDNKPDLVLGTNGEFFLVFNNRSVGPYVDYDVSNVRQIGYDNVTYEFSHYQLGVADIDNDSLPEVISSKKIWPNLGSYNFQNSPNTAIEIGPVGDFSDIDGDGKIDYTTGKRQDSAVFAVRNTSANSPVFAPMVGYSADSPYFYQTQLVDLNADSKPEIIGINLDSNYVLIYKNKIGIATLCPGGSTVLASSIGTGISFQWQANTGSGFVNISNGPNYGGTNTANLQLNNIPSAWRGYQYRCVVDGNNSYVYALQFSNSWTGAETTAWENPANWSCSVVPDSNTNVVLINGTIVINSNVTINTLSLNPGVNLTVSSGYTLTVLH